MQLVERTQRQIEDAYYLDQTVVGCGLDVAMVSIVSKLTHSSVIRD